MNRRDLLKYFGASLVSLSVPLEITQEITIVDVKLDEKFIKTCCIFEFHKTYCNVSMDTKKIWSYVTLIDSNGRKWATDNGTLWRSGLMEFDLDIEEEEDA